MGATKTDDAVADPGSFAPPRQRIRFVRAMAHLAKQRAVGEPASVYISVPPGISQSRQWPQWRARIQGDLPDRTQLLTYEDAFGGREYAWDAFADSLDGLIVVGKQKRAGSRVFILGPVARLELRSLVAQRPVLLYAHDLGLVPVVDCKPAPLPHEHKGTRLKLTVPRRWTRTSETLTSALAALQPPPEETPRTADHLLHPFDAPQEYSST
ncbi:hypothetical protein ACFRR6_24505 [Streptomyces sp. NPDC056891]|uniref:hypothetical protein n=1 Tax=Streptomyces sp. NPDC056891 TaxID=3345961 RepID=UPI003699375E